MQKTATCFLFIILATAFSETLKAQNLVPNPSFEIYDTCPDYLTQINRAIGWYSSLGTPDYFNSCAISSSSVSVPKNWAGNRTPASGNAYIGIITMWPYTNDSKEAIGIQLNTSLQIGVKYYASFKVSLGGRYTNTNWCGINKLGILFSTFQYNSALSAPTCSNCAQIHSDSIVTDTLNWARLTGSFVADSNYSYISIGRFNFRYLTDSIMLVGTDCYSYYYIDDVCLSTDSLTCNGFGEGMTLFNNNSSIQIFPNPARNQIEINGNDIQSLTLYDVLGRVIWLSTTDISSPFQLNTSSFSRGVYFLQARGRGGVVVRKVILSEL